MRSRAWHKQLRHEMVITVSRALTVVALAASLILLLPAVVGEADTPGLEIIQPDELALTYEDRDSSRTSIWVRNTTDRTVDLTFTAVTEDEDGKEDTDLQRKPRLGVAVLGEEEKPTLKRQGPGSVVRYRLLVRPRAGLHPKDVSGALVVTPTRKGPGGRAQGAGASGSIPLTLKKLLLPDQGVTAALLAPFGLAFVLMLAVTFRCTSKKTKINLCSPLPASVDFSKSFASTVTAAGALLGAILAAQVLPEETRGAMSKAAFVALNLLFGIGVAVAGLVYAAFQGAKWKDAADNKGKELETKGTVLGFLVASLITVWAVFGELGVALLAIDEVGQDEGFSSLSLWLFRAMIAAALVLMAVYTWKRVPVIVVAEEKGAQQAPAPARETPVKAAKDEDAVGANGDQEQAPSSPTPTQRLLRRLKPGLLEQAEPRTKDPPSVSLL